MRIRIEFGPSKSPSYPWAIRLAKKLATYGETVEEGIKVHSAEFGDIETFVSLQRCLGGWKSLAYYLDGHPVPVEKLWAIYEKKYPQGLTPVEVRDGRDGPTYYVPSRDVVEAEVVQEGRPRARLIHKQRG